MKAPHLGSYYSSKDCVNLSSSTAVSSIKQHLPQVSIIFDGFHVTKLLNNIIDKIRRSEYANCQNKGLRVLKGQRFLLFRNFVDLENDQKSSLQKLLEINELLSIAHSMKEQSKLFWQSGTRMEGARFLGWWIIQAIESGVELLTKTARTLLYHFEGLF